MVDQRLIHRRHTGQCRRLDARDSRQRRLGIEPWQHGNHPARQYGAIQHTGIGEDVKERQHSNDAVALVGVRVNRMDLPRIGRQILVRQHRALWHSCRPAGILDQRNFTRVDDDLLQLAGHARQPDNPRIIGQRRNVVALEQLIQHALGGGQPISQRPHNNPVDQPLIEQRRRARHQLRHVARHNYACATVADLIRELRHRIKRRHIDDDPARHQRAVVGDQIVGDVRQEQANAIPLGHPQRLQPASKALCHRADLAIAALATHEVGKDGPRRPRHACREHRRQRHRCKLLVPLPRMDIIGAPDTLGLGHDHSLN